MAIHPKTLKLSGFKGLNNVLDAESTPSTYLKKVENINLDKLGGVKKRKGYDKIDTADYSSLWASDKGLGCYAVRNGDLIQRTTDGSYITLISNVGDNPISFEEVDDKIYYSSINTSGIIDFDGPRGWGLQPTTSGLVLTQVAGTMPAGTYMIGFTSVSSDGRESGVTVTSSITFSSSGGIRLTLPTSADPLVTYYRIYCSTQNGNTLYFSRIGLEGEIVTISDDRNLIAPLRTFNLYPPPLGHIVKYYRGRVYLAQDNVLWFSEPYQYEHFKIDSNYIEFPERIREVMPVEDGIWIAADRLYYLSGEDALTFKRSTKENIKVVEGTSQKISGSYVHLDNTPIGYKWLVTSDLGIFILFNQGLVINLTSQNVAIDSADSGAAVFLQAEGINQYLSILKTNQNPNNAVVGDLVETTIVRNGVVIT